MNNLLVSTSDGIPGAKVVDVLGYISARGPYWGKLGKETVARKLLQKAEGMGANAVVNFVYEPCGFFGLVDHGSGLAVKVKREIS